MEMNKTLFLLGVSLAPTAQLVDKKRSHELEMCKLKVELQKDKIDELIKERDYLKEQLATGTSPYTKEKFLCSWFSCCGCISAL